MSANKNDYVSDRRLYLDKDGKVVEHDDVNKLTLLVAEGGSLSQEDALKYGLVDAEGKKVEAKAESQDEEDLSSHTVAELKEIAEEKGIDLSGAKLKDDIVAAIEGGGEEEAESAKKSSKKK